MATMHDSTTLGRARLTFADPAEVDDFVAHLERFERGELTADQWRAYRLVRGTYGQRQDGQAHMVRVKIPQGILDGAQLHALADVADAHARGFAHITTRQNIQLHFVDLHDVEPVLRRLEQVGLTTREACGTVTATVTLGDLTSAQLRLIAALCAAHGDGTVRLTTGQNLLFRWVPLEQVPALHARLAAAGLGGDGADGLSDVTSCPGAETCRLAVTRSRGLGALLGEQLRARPDLVEALPGLDIKISGCPNGCGQHHVAGLGFQGSVRKVDGKAAPQYFVMVGGGADGEAAHFGRLAARVPARRIPQVVERLAALYAAERAAGETPRAFLRRVDLGRVKAALADLEHLAAEDAAPADFVDLGEDREFTVQTQAGECVA